MAFSEHTTWGGTKKKKEKYCVLVWFLKKLSQKDLHTKCIEMAQKKIYICPLSHESILLQTQKGNFIKSISLLFSLELMTMKILSLLEVWGEILKLGCIYVIYTRFGGKNSYLSNLVAMMI